VTNMINQNRPSSNWKRDNRTSRNLISNATQSVDVYSLGNTGLVESEYVNISSAGEERRNWLRSLMALVKLPVKLISASFEHTTRKKNHH